MGADDLRSLEAADVQATFCRALSRQWLALGVSQAFVAPGSRSTPMAIALATDARWSVSVFLDERSAAFAALGYGMATGLPAVVLCTSGTAAAHLHAAVIEADQSGVPMIVVTADRPPELRDVGAAQTIDQTKLFGTSVRWFHDPGVAHVDASDSWRSLAARTVHRSLGGRPGPVHLNLPFREPLLGRAVDIAGLDVPLSSSDGRPELSSDALKELANSVSGRRGMIVAGRGSTPAVADLARALGWPILADVRSAIQDGTVRFFDSILRNERFASQHRPEIVVRIGEPPASKVLAQWIAGSKAEQVHITEDDRWIDADHRLSRRVRASVDSVCDTLTISGVMSAPEGWLESWLDADSKAAKVCGDVLGGAGVSGPQVARAFAAGLPHGSHLVVSSSMPIRDLEWFGGTLPHLHVHSNRGANGIDGVIATAIGVATATKKPTGLLIGDVAFVHDSSSLAGLAARGVDLRVMIVDNDGGGIFHFLPQASAIDEPTFELLFGTPHRTDLAALAGSHGVEVSVITDVNSVANFASNRGPCVAVARTDRRSDVELHRSIQRLVGEALASSPNQR